jgi:hypothetical protein
MMATDYGTNMCVTSTSKNSTIKKKSKADSKKSGNLKSRQSSTSKNKVPSDIMLSISKEDDLNISYEY